MAINKTIPSQKNGAAADMYFLNVCAVALGTAELGVGKGCADVYRLLTTDDAYPETPPPPPLARLLLKLLLLSSFSFSFSSSPSKNTPPALASESSSSGASTMCVFHSMYMHMEKKPWVRCVVVRWVVLWCVVLAWS